MNTHDKETGEMGEELLAAMWTDEQIIREIERLSINETTYVHQSVVGGLLRRMRDEYEAQRQQDKARIAELEAQVTELTEANLACGQYIANLQLAALDRGIPFEGERYVD
jgi:hypothetical protein